MSRQGGMTAGEWLHSRSGENIGKGKSDKKYSFLSDSSSDESFSVNQFMKTTKDSEDKDVGKKPNDFVKPDRPKTSRGLPQKKQSTGSSFQATTALDRFSQLEKQILSRQNAVKSVLSSSDMDLYISSDSEIKNDILDIKKKQSREEVRPKKSSLKTSERKLPDFRDSLDGSQHKLLERKSVSFASLSDKSEASDTAMSLNDFMSEQYSDEASLDDVLPGKITSSLVFSIDELEPADEITEDIDKTGTVNLASVDQLLGDSYSDDFEKGSKSVSPYDDSSSFPHSTKKLKATKQRSIRSDTTSASRDPDYTEDFHSDADSDDTLRNTESITEEVTEEIHTESASIVSESIKTETESDSYTEQFDSVSSSIVTSESTLKSSSRRKSSYSDDYSSRFDSTVTQSTLSPHRTPSTLTPSPRRRSPLSSLSSPRRHSPSSLSPSPRRRSPPSSLTPSPRHRSSRSSTPPRHRLSPHSNRSPSPQHRSPSSSVTSLRRHRSASTSRKEKHFSNVEVQTEPTRLHRRLSEEDYLSTKYAWPEANYLLPRPVINNEALKILTSYSPGVLAVHEMLKQQLEFTRDFIARTDRLYKSAADSLLPDYQYSSLQEARAIIDEERKKRNLPPKYPGNKVP